MRVSILYGRVKAMRIGIITPYINNFGGGEVFLNNLIKYSKTANDRNEFILFSADPNVFDVPVIEIPNISNYKLFSENIFKAIRILKKEKLDCIILNDYYIGQFSILFKFFFKRVITLIHGEINYNNRILSLPLKQIVLYLRIFLVKIGSNRIFTVNKTNLKYFQKKQIKYIGNFVEKIPDVTIDEHEYDFLYIGRLIDLKRPIYILECFSQYMKKYDQKSKIAIVGDGDLKDDVIKYVLNHDLENNVKVVGEVSHDDVFSWYQRGECLLLLSRTEGFPTVILEALASGLPCIATNVGSNNEIIRNGINGYIVDVANTTEEVVEYMNSIKHLNSEDCKKSVEKYLISSFYENFTSDLERVCR